MSQQLESTYDKYMDELKQKLPNVSPKLVHRIMYLERRLEDEQVSEPNVDMNIEYKSDANMDAKLSNIREKFGLEAEYSDSHNILLAHGRMKLDTLAKIAEDQDIVELSGKANPTIRA